MLNSKALWAIVLGFLVLHIGLAIGVNLIEDEAYYQLWARFPSAGYYDHPPMVAWGIAAGQALFGESLLGIRAFSILAAALVSLLTWRIAWLFSKDETVAVRATLWGAVMLPFAVLGFGATPDAGSVLFWTAAVWGLSEVVTGGSARWWLGVGLFAGLGVLSKFTNLFFGASLVLWLLANRDGRNWLGTWQVWAGAALGLLVLIPFTLWNIEHNWIGLERQFGRLGEARAFSPGEFAGFGLSFVLLVTPLIFWRVLRSLWSGKVPAVLIWISAPIVIYLTYHALKTQAGGQWLVPIYPTLAVIAALAAPKGWSARWATPSALALGALVLVLGLWPGRPIIGGHLFSQMRGWQETRTEILTLAKIEGATWVATDAYGLTGQLNHYLAQDLPVWSVTQAKRYGFRGSFPTEFCDQKGLFISRTKFPEGIPYFVNTEPQADILRGEGKQVYMRYYLAIVSGVKACG